MKGRRTVIPIFIPHQGCPHRCIYCDQRRIASAEDRLPSPEEIAEEVRRWIRERRKRGTEEVQVAFYGGSFTALPLEVQGELLKAVMPYVGEGVDSLRLSTRPDALSPEGLKLLKEHAVRTVELGVQSLHPEVLKLSRRGYTPERAEEAVLMLKAWGFEVGVQLMLGLPGDTRGRFMETVSRTIALAPHFVRLYPTLVIRGTALERWYKEGRYRPLDLEEAILWTAEALREFEGHGVRVVRMGLQPTPELEASVVAGPYHPAFGQLVRSRLAFEKALHLLKKSGLKRAVLKAHPRGIPELCGQKGENLSKLRKALSMEELRVKADPSLGEGELVAEAA